MNTNNQAVRNVERPREIAVHFTGQGEVFGGTVAAPLANATTGGTPVPPTEFLTKRELAALLKVTVRTLETWLREGRLPFIKVSKSVRFHWPTVLAHLNAKTQTRKTES